MMISTMKSCVL